MEISVLLEQILIKSHLFYNFFVCESIGLKVNLALYYH